MMPRARKWSRDELLLAMNLYCQLPFGKLHKGTSSIIELATAIGRTPSSVAMKLCNLASLDPAERLRGVAGLTKASRADRAIWDEFHSDWEGAVVESQKLYDERVNKRRDTSKREANIETPKSFDRPRDSATEQFVETKVRIGQDFFRRSVLASYVSRCCVSGITLPELLIASHIVPWHTYPQHRLDPRNGLCLSRLHDAAFDRGLVTFDSDFRLVLSRKLKEHVTNNTLKVSFINLEGQALTLPEKFYPSSDFVAKHRESIFVG